jgi:WD40 repeat protein
MADVFISYSRKDKPFVVKLNDALKKAGKETWVDWEGIMPSEEWLKEIYTAIESADTVVYVISPDSAKSEVCGEEIEHAIKCNKRLVPIVCRDVNAKDVPKAAAAHNWIFFRETDDFDPSFELLLKAINTDIDWVRTHTRLLTRAIEWENAKRDPSFMLTGHELRRAEEWLARAGNNTEPHPTPLQTEYILSSRRQASVRNFRALLAAIVITFAAAILLLLVRENKQRANLYLAEELQSKAIWALTNHDVDTAEVLLAKSMSLDDRQETRERFLEARSRAPKLAKVIENDGYHVMALSRNGKWFALANDGKQMLLGRTDQPNVFVPLQGLTGLPASVRFGNNGTMLAVAETDSVKVFDTATGKQKFAVAAKLNSPQCVAFTRDGSMLATGGKDLVVKVWSGVDGKLLHQYHGHREQVSCLAFSPDGKTLASAGWEHDVLIWDVATEKNLFRLKGHQDFVESLAFSPDGKTLASGSIDNTVILWDVKSGRNLRSCEGEKAGIISLTFTPDGLSLFSGSEAGKVRLWDVATGHNLLTISSRSTRIDSMTYLTDSSTLVTAGDDGYLNIWDMAYANHKRELLTLRGHKGVASMVAFSPDGRELGSSSEDNTAKLWDTSTGDCERTFVGHTTGVECVNFTPDGRTMVTGGRDSTVRIWDVATGKALQVIKHPAPARWVQFFNGGKMLATGCDDGKLRIFDASTWKLKSMLPCGDTVLTFAFGPGDRILAVGSQDGLIRLWDMSNLKSITAMRCCRQGLGVWGLGFRQNGNYLISGGEDGALKEWDMSTKSEVHKWTGHEGAIWDIAVDPRGYYAATAGQDSTVKVWDLANPNAPPITLAGTDGPVWGVDFNANGTELAAGGQDWAVRVWNMPELRTMLTENASDLLSESEQETGLTIIDHDVEPLPVKKLREPSVIISKLP